MIGFSSQLNPPPDATDCPFNNNSKVTRVKAKGGYDKNQVKYDLCVTAKPPARLNDEKSEAIVSLQTNLTDSELAFPVRNLYCPQKVDCLWSLDELFQYLDSNLFVDTDGKTLCYYCVGCQKEVFKENCRYLRDLYLDKELFMYITQAKKHFQAESEPKKEVFKKGFIRIHKVGLVQYQYKVKTEAGKISKTKILRDTRQRPQDDQIKFDYAGRFTGIKNLQTALTVLGKSLSKKLDIQKKWRTATGSLEPSKIKEFYMSMAKVASENIPKFISLSNTQNRRLNEFTFVLKSQCHTNISAPELTFLIVYYPLLRLWRKFLVKGANKIFPIIDSAVYIKDPRFPCIYVIGGGRIKYVNEKEGMMPVVRKKIIFQKETYEISLKNIDPLEPTKIVPVKKKISIKGKGLANSGIINTETNETVIGQLHHDHLVAKELSPLPENMSLSAGVFYKDSLYVFGGIVTQDKNKEVHLKSAYKLNLSKPGGKWEKLRPLATARFSHSALVYKDRIYLVGGMSAGGTDLNLNCKNIDIYNPANDTYESKPMVNNPYIEANNEVFSDKCIVCQLNDREFLMVNGYFFQSYIFNAETLQYYPGGSQIVLPVLTRAWRGLLNDSGPRIQQVFDSMPPKLNDIFFYAHNNIQEEQVRVVYGTKDSWYLSHEEDQEHLSH